MRPVSTAAGVRALDAAVIEGLGHPGLVLMEVAGRGIAEAVHRRWPRARVAVACGPGNNGGDGWVAARWLALWGHEVRVATVLDARSPDAVHNRDLARALGLEPVPLEEALAGADVALDALLGTGQRSAPRGAVARAVAALRAFGGAVVAVDLPTGVCADTGRALGDRTVRADLTVTLGRLKPGLLCEPGATLAGEVEVVDIGLDLAPRAGAAPEGPDAWLLEATDVAAWLPLLPAAAAKWDRGHVAVRAGRGAAVLAAHGAFRAGAGLVTLLAPRDEWAGLKGLRPEVILAEPDALDPRRHDVVVVGPGLGTDGAAAAEVRALWAEFPGAVVADADALTLLARDPVAPPAGAVRAITPHSAEAARLLGRSRAEVEADRLGAVRALRALPIGAVPLLKGPHTLVGADPPLFLPFRDARLATAGSGDVLAGMVGALLARGLAPERALAAAAWLHGAAAADLDEHATASDLLAAIRPRP